VKQAGEGGGRASRKAGGQAGRLAGSTHVIAVLVPHSILVLLVCAAVVDHYVRHWPALAGKKRSRRFSNRQQPNQDYCRIGAMHTSSGSQTHKSTREHAVPRGIAAVPAVFQSQMEASGKVHGLTAACWVQLKLIP
jgi:hypothetical protein